MTDNAQLKQQAHDGLESYLAGKGINTRKPFRCLSPDHEDKNPSMAFDARRGRVHCFACGVDWDIFDLVGAEYGLVGFPEKFAKACEVTGVGTGRNGGKERSTFLLEKRKVAKENHLGVETTNARNPALLQAERRGADRKEAKENHLGQGENDIATDSMTSQQQNSIPSSNFNINIAKKHTVTAAKKGNGKMAGSRENRSRVPPVAESNEAKIPEGTEPVKLATIPKGPPLRESEGSALGVAPYLLACQSRLPSTPYPAQRGLSPETCARFGIGYDPVFGPARWQALIIPTGKDSFTARNTDPTADKKNRIRKTGASPLYNWEILYEDGPPVFIVEGEIDALSVYEAGGEAVALGSVANAQRLLSLLDEKRTGRTLLICMDRDESGQKAASALCEGLSGMGVKHLRVQLGDEQASDPNDALLRDRDGLVAQVQALAAIEREAEDIARAEYEKTSLQSVYDAFLRGLSKGVDTPSVATGFARLDGFLDGGLYEGLYIVGAISSLGKTSLVLQIADQIAASGQDVLLFSLEMARDELLAKSLSRMTLIEALRQKIDTGFAKTTRGITVAKRWVTYSEIDHNLFHDAAERYRPATAHLYVHEGVGDIGAAEIAAHVRRHVQFTGRTPVVIIDYLQILAPYSDRATDKQNTDKAVLELKRLSRDMRLPLVAISSFNRASYKEAVTMEAFKESGAIEYSSDVLIGLQLRGAGQQGFDPTVEKEKDPREVELVILKNRHGPAGKRVVFDYYPRFHYFRERPS